MKIRESGMPERDMWETFFNPAEILAMLGLNSQTVDVAEFGCGYGYGTFSLCKMNVISVPSEKNIRLN